RLYDPTESRYVDLDEIEKLVMDQVDFVVIDKLSGEDITRAVLLQVIAAREQRDTHSLTRDFLLQTIRSQARGQRALTASFLEQSLNLLQATKATETSAQTAQRLAQNHFKRWRAVQEDIDRKLRN